MELFTYTVNYGTKYYIDQRTEVTLYTVIQKQEFWVVNHSESVKF